MVGSQAGLVAQQLAESFITSGNSIHVNYEFDKYIIKAYHLDKGRNRDYIRAYPSETHPHAAGVEP